MIRCLCCNKEIVNPTEYESQKCWHERCMKSFFGFRQLPELICSEKELERLASLTVNKGLTVPGVQKKISLHLSAKDKVTRLTIVDYPTGYILKPQSEEFAFLPEAEFMVMKMAEAARIKIVPNALIPVGTGYAYITKRIDRKDNGLLAMEDFCQLSGRVTEDKYRGSYENCSRVIRRYSQNTGIDITEFYYRLLFCFLTANSDMHLKNFSLIEDAPGSRIFSLAAAYDLLPVNILMPADQEQTALTLNGKKKGIRRKDFLAAAENMGVREKTAKGLIEHILRYRDEFVRIADSAYIPEEMKEEWKTLLDARIDALS